MSAEKALVAKPQVEIWRRPDFLGLFDPDFLFDFLYIMGSISHRYGAIPRRCYNYAVVKAAGLGENIQSPEGDIANFERTLLKFH